MTCNKAKIVPQREFQSGTLAIKGKRCGSYGIDNALFGNRLLSFNNGGRGPGGVIYQDIPTQEGRPLDLSFYFGNFGLFGTRVQVLGVLVTDTISGKVLLRQVITDGDLRSGSAVFQAYTYTFNPIGPLTRISFSDAGSTDVGASDGLVDNVAVKKS